ncbi:hypothetical protein [Pseudomonas fluvialis]|uniref:hypothetical protein n=1 Tax=Pseudomonas fluvialis TaxID=1793966 RepID=UPI00370BE295
MKIFSYRYLPLNIYVGYSGFVLLSLIAGPIKYKDLNYSVLASFLFGLVFLFVLGYFFGARGDYRKFSIYDRSISYQRIIRIFQILLIFGVFSSIVQWVSFFISGGELSLSDIGGNYVKGYDGYERGQAVVDFIYVANIFSQAVVALVLLFSFYYFKVMGGLAKISFLFVLATYLLINVVGTGKQKYLGDFVVFSTFCMLINFASEGRRFRLRTLGVAVAALCVVFLLFIEILRQRYLAAGIGLDNIYEKVHPLISWDESSIVFGLIGSDYALALGIFLGYFSNGLYGLYLSLTLPFEWSYFVGNSYSLGRIVEIFLSSDGFILENTYPYRVGETYGWGFDKWHSMFAWLASDITFVGVLLLSPLFAFVYARLWLQAIKATNPFSGPLFIYLSLGLVFSYANNQIMHGLSGVIVLMTLVGGWLFSRNLPCIKLLECERSRCCEVIE